MSTLVGVADVCVKRTASVVGADLEESLHKDAILQRFLGLQRLDKKIKRLAKSTSSLMDDARAYRRRLRDVRMASDTNKIDAVAIAAPVWNVVP